MVYKGINTTTTRKKDHKVYFTIWYFIKLFCIFIEQFCKKKKKKKYRYIRGLLNFLVKFH